MQPLDNEALYSCFVCQCKLLKINANSKMESRPSISTSQNAKNINDTSMSELSLNLGVARERPLFRRKPQFFQSNLNARFRLWIQLANAIHYTRRLLMPLVRSYPVGSEAIREVVILGIFPNYGALIVAQTSGVPRRNCCAHKMGAGAPMRRSPNHRYIGPSER